MYRKKTPFENGYSSLTPSPIREYDAVQHDCPVGSINLTTTPVTPAANRVFTVDELEERIARHAARVAAEDPEYGQRAEVVRRIISAGRKRKMPRGS